MIEYELLRVVDEADARQLPALIEEWRTTPGLRGVIARALRIDLALLDARPELAVPCVYRRCAWLDNARAAMAAWAARWSAGGHWLRALRPLPTDAGIVEEYRTSRRGTLRFSADAGRLGVFDDTGALVWDRTTGRHGDSPHSFTPPEPPHTTLGPSSAGVAMLRTGGRMLEVAVGSNEEPFAVSALPGGLALVNTRVDDPWDDRSELYLVDVAIGRVAWRTEGFAVDAHVLGTQIASLAGRLTMRELATGELAGTWDLDAQDLAVAADGTLATRAGDVIRVWDLATTARHREHASGKHLQYSPDGALLLAGRELCNARTGAAIASLDITSMTGWLEGGPPDGYVRLTNQGCCEITPMGLRYWNTEGVEVLRDSDRRAGAGDSACFDPSGRFHAVARRGNAIELFALRRGKAIWKHSVKLLRDGRRVRFGFSADGEQLWWQTAAGPIEAVATTSPSIHRLAATPPELTEEWIEAVDGCIVFEGSALPWDEQAALVSPDRRTIASRTAHHVLV